MKVVYEAEKFSNGAIDHLFRRVDSPNRRNPESMNSEYQEFTKDGWVDSVKAHDVFFGYGTCTWRVTEEEAARFMEALKGGKLIEYCRSFDK